METNVFGYLVEQKQCETPELLEFHILKIGNFAICEVPVNTIYFILYDIFISVLCGLIYFIFILSVFILYILF